MTDKAKHHDKMILMTIEDVLSCPGRCPGCPTAQIDRNTRESSMSEETMDLSINRLYEYIEEKGDIESIEIILVIGDHLYLPEEYLVSVYKKFESKFRDIIPHHSSAFIFSAALYQHFDQIIPRLERYEAMMSDDFPMRINAVLDLLNKVTRPKLWDEQIRTIIHIAKNMKMEVDVSTNLSTEVIQAVSAKEYYDICLSLGVPEVIVNWTPTLNNVTYTYKELSYTEDWLLEFSHLVLKDGIIKVDFLSSIIGSMKNKMDQTGFEGLENIVKPLCGRYLYVDSQGYLMPWFDAIGDIAHHPMMGYSHDVKLDEYSISEGIDKYLPEVYRHMYKGTVQKACFDCDVQSTCMTSGFHVYTDFLRAGVKMDILKQNPLNQDRCPHVGQKIFQTVRDYLSDSM